MQKSQLVKIQRLSHKSVIYITPSPQGPGTSAGEGEESLLELGVRRSRVQTSSAQEKSSSLMNLQQLSLAAEDLYKIIPVKIPA